MSKTIQEKIIETKFTTAKHGYHPTEVDDLLDEIYKYIDNLQQQNKIYQEENDVLKTRLENLTSKFEQVKISSAVNTDISDMSLDNNVSVRLSKIEEVLNALLVEIKNKR